MTLARWVLAWFAPPEWRESMLGDLTEERARRRQSGRYAGVWWLLGATIWTTGRLRWAASRGLGGSKNGGGWRQDWMLAFRAWRRQPALTAMLLLTLTLGIGANTAVFSIANWMMFRPVPGVTAPESLATIRLAAHDGGFFTISVPELQGLSALPGFSAITAHADVSLNVSRDDGQATRVEAHAVTAGYFDVLGQTMTLGRAFTAAEDNEEDIGQAQRVIISHRYWSTYFDRDPQVLGRTLRINETPFTIIGVAAAGFRGPSRSGAIDLWVPLGSHQVTLPAYPAKLASSSAGLFFSAYGRVVPGTTLALIDEQAEAWRAGLLNMNPSLGKLKRATFVARPGIDVPSWESERLTQTFGLLIAVVAFVLLLACANVGNLLLARAHERQAEVATRMALGASRGRVIRQWLLEGIALCVCGGAGALLVTLALGRVLDGVVITPSLPALTQVGLDWRVFMFALATSFVACAGGAFLPAVVGSRVDLVASLKQSGRGQTPAGRRIRRALAIVQVASSVVLLAGSFLLLRSMTERYAVPLGYDTDQVLAFSIEPGLRHKDDARQRRLYASLVDQLRTVPGVTAAGLAWVEPFRRIGGGASLRAEGQLKEDNISADSNMVSAGFFAALGVRILDGREFADAESFRSEEPGAGVLIVNESLARQLFGTVNAAGRRVTMEYPEGRVRTIVGVVADLRTRNLDEPVSPTAYEPFGQTFLSGWGTMHVRLTGSIESSMPAIRAAVAEVDPGLPIYDVETLRQALDRHLAESRLVTIVTAAFAIVATALSMIGLYGVLALGVTERQREFSIRAALGAAPTGVARLVMREALSLTLAGTAAGLLAFVWLSRYAESRLFGVTALDPVALFTTLGCVVLAGVFVSLPPALRAARSTSTL